MEFGNVVDSGSGLENLKAQGFELVIPAFKKVFNVQKADVDPALFKKIHHFHQDNGRDDDDRLTPVSGEGPRGESFNIGDEWPYELPACKKAFVCRRYGLPGERVGPFGNGAGHRQGGVAPRRSCSAVHWVQVEFVAILSGGFFAIKMLPAFCIQSGKWC